MSTLSIPGNWLNRSELGAKQTLIMNYHDHYIFFLLIWENNHIRVLLWSSSDMQNTTSSEWSMSMYTRYEKST